MHDGYKLCFSCQKQVWITTGPVTTPPSTNTTTPKWSFISSQHCHRVNTRSAIAPFLAVLFIHALHHSPKANIPAPWFHISLCRSVWGPAEKPPPGVRSGVIYHSRLCRELTFAQAFYSTIVIESPCLFEDTNRYNYVRTPQLYITRLTERDNQWVIFLDQLNKRWTPHWPQPTRKMTNNKEISVRFLFFLSLFFFFFLPLCEELNPLTKS